jgi:hypothetical protein
MDRRTNRGKSLMPILEMMCDWGKRIGRSYIILTKKCIPPSLSLAGCILFI